MRKNLGLEDRFKVVETKSALVEGLRSNAFFDILVHKVEFPGTGAKPTNFFTIEHKFFACAAVCINYKKELLLLNVPRFPLRNQPGDEYSWELPGGRCNNNETPCECLIRELREETGIVAEDITLILNDYFYPESSFATEKLYLYLAQNLRFNEEKTPEPEGAFQSKWLDFNEAIGMIFNGEIRSSWTIIGILASKIILDKNNL